MASFDGEVTDDSVTNIPVHWGNLCPTELMCSHKRQPYQLVSAGGSIVQGPVAVLMEVLGHLASLIGIIHVVPI